MKEIDVRTQAREEFIDLTSRVKDAIFSSGIQNGLCTIFIPHTTAGITINENADPSVRADILMTLHGLVPDSLPYTHMEGNSPAHVKASLLGSSVHLIVHNGNPVLGTWQGIYFGEFDGPRNRKAHIKVIESD
ncbi:MAG: secondary thiamine-phosphate synthase enzyme YjbQ [Candidatus Aminicenantes bacterium]